MWWRSQRTTEQLPWYRSPDYDGNLTEDEKLQLDAFRMRDRHPAVLFEDLPDEAQCYISRIELEVYDLKQEKAAGRAIVTSLIGAAWLYVNYFGVQSTESIFPYIGGFALLIIPWFLYSAEWKMNAMAVAPTELNSPSSTDELIRKEWELNYIVSRKTSAF